MFSVCWAFLGCSFHLGLLLCQLWGDALQSTHRMGSCIQGGILGADGIKPHRWAVQAGMGHGSNGNTLPREMLGFNSLLCGEHCPVVKPFPPVSQGKLKAPGRITGNRVKPAR